MSSDLTVNQSLSVGEVQTSATSAVGGVGQTPTPTPSSAKAVDTTPALRTLPLSSANAVDTEVSPPAGTASGIPPASAETAGLSSSSQAVASPSLLPQDAKPENTPLAPALSRKEIEERGTRESIAVMKDVMHAARNTDSPATDTTEVIDWESQPVSGLTKPSVSSDDNAIEEDKDTSEEDESILDTTLHSGKNVCNPFSLFTACI